MVDGWTLRLLGQYQSRMMSETVEDCQELFSILTEVMSVKLHSFIQPSSDERDIAETTFSAQPSKKESLHHLSKSFFPITKRHPKRFRLPEHHQLRSPSFHSKSFATGKCRLDPFFSRSASPSPPLLQHASNRSALKPCCLAHLQISPKQSLSRLTVCAPRRKTFEFGLGKRGCSALTSNGLWDLLSLWHML